MTGALRREEQAASLFAVLIVAAAAFGLLQSLVIPVLPTLQARLGVSETAATWIITAYLLSAVVSTPIVGRVGDLTGKKRMFVFVLSALAAGSVMGALAGSLPVMILARVIQGIGGGVLPLAFGIIRDHFPGDRVIGAVGAIASLTAVGGTLGMVAAGPIVDVLGYHWLFWLPAATSAIVAAAAHIVIPESQVVRGRNVSFISAIAFSVALVALLLVISQGTVWGWTSKRVITLAIASALSMVGWVAAESRAAVPLVDLRMMRERTLLLCNLVALLLGAAMFSLFGFIPELVQTPSDAGYGFGASVSESGLFLVPATFIQLLVGMSSGRLAREFGGKALIMSGCIINTLAMLALALAHDQKWQLYTATAGFGVGIGLCISGLAGLVVITAHAGQTGVASGINNNMRSVGGTIGIAVMAGILAAHNHGVIPDEVGYTIGFGVMTLCLVIASIAAKLIPSRLA